MNAKDFKVEFTYCLSNWGGLEIMVESEDYIRYRENFSSDKPMKISRPCKIYYASNGRAYFRYGNTRIYLDTLTRAFD